MGLKKIFKQVVIISSIGLLAMGLSGCGNTTPTNTDAAQGNTGTSEGNEASVDIMSKDTLVMGLDDNFPPMGFLDEKGELTGYDVELAKAVSEELGKTIKLQSINWDMKEAELSAGNIDLIWNGYTITEERKEKVAFTVPYLENKQVVVTLADSDIQTKADLAGKVVGAQQGSSAIDAIESEPEVAETFKDGKPVTYETNNDALMDLEAGRVDAIVADETLVKYYISNRGAEKYNILEEDFGEEQYGIGVRKGETALVDAINEAYAALKADGTIKALSEKWFGDDISK